MVMEVCCGQCNGRLLVETPGVIVACPHCGVHLSIPSSEDHPDDFAANPPGTNSHEDSLAPVSTSSVNEPVDHPPTTNSDSDNSPPELSEATVSWSEPPTPASHPAPTSSVFSVTGDERPLSDRTSDVVVTGLPDDSIVDESQSRLVDEDHAATPVTTSVQQGPPTEPETPDFSWLGTTNVATSPGSVSPPQFSFGLPDAKVIDDQPPVPVHIAPAAGLSASTGLEQTVSAVSPVSDTGAAAQPMLDATFAAKTYSDVETLNVAADVWSAPQEPIAAPGFSLDIPQAQHPPSVVDRHAFTLTTPVVADSSAENPSMQSMTSAAVDSPKTVDAGDAKRSRLELTILLVASYASLMTIYAAYVTLFGRKHQLESLPDLKTVQQAGGRATVPRPENDLPPGHELKLGQTQRFGNIRVTPLRVTRGPIVFEHYSGAQASSRSPSDPVLKLWLKFENVSNEQSIVPLDTTLMFFQRLVGDHVASYNVIFREADRKQRNAQFYYPFDRMAVDSEWTMVGQHTNEELSPGHSFETFVPSTENTEGLNGELVWRVHFRKGYGPQTGNGVTTLIDVHFNSNDIKPDPA